MNFRTLHSALLGTLLCTGSLLIASAHAAVINNPTNGHFYEAVSTPAGISWEDARIAASQRAYQGLPGHLVTITSSGETSFIAAQLPSAISERYALGGYQIPGSPEPAGGWTWVTGEKWDYTDWGQGEPSNGQNKEQYLEYLPMGHWNDVAADNMFQGYLVEYESTGIRSITTPNPDIYGGRSARVTVTLNTGAPTGGAMVTLVNTNPAVNMPASVLVPDGQISLTFLITTNTVTTAQTGTVTASYGGQSISMNLSVHRVRIKSMTLSSDSLNGATTGHCVIVLEAPTPIPFEVKIENSNMTAATVPTSMTIPAGSYYGTFDIKSRAVSTPTDTFITTRGGLVSFSQKLVVFPAVK